MSAFTDLATRRCQEEHPFRFHANMVDPPNSACLRCYEWAAKYAPLADLQDERAELQDIACPQCGYGVLRSHTRYECDYHNRCDCDLNTVDALLLLGYRRSSPSDGIMLLTDLLRDFKDGDEHGWDTEFRFLRSTHQGKIKALRNDVAVNGIREPILLGNDGRVWDGHHRLCVADAIGLIHVPVRHVQVSPQLPLCPDCSTVLAGGACVTCHKYVACAHEWKSTEPEGRFCGLCKTLETP